MADVSRLKLTKHKGVTPSSFTFLTLLLDIPPSWKLLHLGGSTRRVVQNHQWKQRAKHAARRISSAHPYGLQKREIKKRQIGVYSRIRPRETTQSPLRQSQKPRRRLLISVWAILGVNVVLTKEKGHDKLSSCTINAVEWNSFLRQIKHDKVFAVFSIV